MGNGRPIKIGKSGDGTTAASLPALGKDAQSRKMPPNQFHSKINDGYLAVVEEFQQWAHARGESYTYAARKALMAAMGQPFDRDETDL